MYGKRSLLRLLFAKYIFPYILNVFLDIYRVVNIHQLDYTTFYFKYLNIIFFLVLN